MRHLVEHPQSKVGCRQFDKHFCACNLQGNRSTYSVDWRRDPKSIEQHVLDTNAGKQLSQVATDV